MKRCSKPKNRSDIFRDWTTGEVVVLDETGKECFRRPHSRQIVSIAHSIYSYHKHIDDYKKLEE